MNKSTVTWGILIGLILFSGLAAAAYATVASTIAAGPGASPGGITTILEAPSVDLSTRMVELPFSLPGIGNQVPDIAIILGLLGLIGGAVVGTGIALYIVNRILGGLITDTKASDDYAKGVNQLENEQKAFVKEMKTARPPDPVPDHDRPGWLAISTILMGMTMLAFFGAAYATSFTASSNIWNWGYLFALAGLIIGLFLFTRNRMSRVSSEATASIDWGRIWVLLTGLIIVGIGMGFMFFVRGG